MYARTFLPKLSGPIDILEAISLKRTKTMTELVTRSSITNVMPKSVQVFDNLKYCKASYRSLLHCQILNFFSRMEKQPDTYRK